MKTKERGGKGLRTKERGGGKGYKRPKECETEFTVIRGQAESNCFEREWV